MVPAEADPFKAVRICS